jgi:hypothetical protein
VKKVGWTENEERDRDRDVLGKKKGVLGSQNDNYLETKFEC